jgi:hypothetical protein
MPEPNPPLLIMFALLEFLLIDVLVKCEYTFFNDLVSYLSEENLARPSLYKCTVSGLALVIAT